MPSPSDGRTPDLVRALNEATNKVYVTNQNSFGVEVIDGATNAVSTFNVGLRHIQGGIAVNAATDRVYVANNGSDTTTLIEPSVARWTTAPARCIGSEREVVFEVANADAESDPDARAAPCVRIQRSVDTSNGRVYVTTTSNSVVLLQDSPPTTG